MTIDGRPVLPAAGGGDTRRVAFFSLPDSGRPAPPGPARPDRAPAGRPTTALRPPGWEYGRG